MFATHDNTSSAGADWYRPLCQSLSLSLSFSPSPSPSSPISLHGWPSGLPDAQLLIWRPPRRPITGPAGPPGEFPGVLTSCLIRPPSTAGRKSNVGAFESNHTPNISTHINTHRHTRTRTQTHTHTRLYDPVCLAQYGRMSSFPC